eukprot:6631018-Pyramimonas_sp.AAC.2
MRKADERLGRAHTTGINMAAHYGVGVNGVDDQELLAIRRQAMSYLAPVTRGANLRAKLALH